LRGQWAGKCGDGYPGNFNFSRAVREWCFVQLRLIELCQVVVEFAYEIGLEEFSFDPVDLDTKIAAQREAGNERGIASTLLDMAGERDSGFRLSKPNFARRLARFVLNESAKNGKSRPILDLAEQLVSLTWADRRLSGQLRD
jgi:hypothetical protein